MIRKLFAGLLAAMTAAQADAAIARYGHLVLSGDGKSIATVENPPTGTPASNHGVITMRAARDGKIIRRLDPCPTCSYADLAWSTTGTLTFLGRDAARKQTFVFVSARDVVRRVAVVDGLAASPRFSPQGDRIALLVTLGATKDIGATQAGARQIGEIGSRYDEQRLALIDGPGTASDATPTMLTAADRYIYEFAWTPNGRTLVATTAPGQRRREMVGGQPRCV